MNIKSKIKDTPDDELLNLQKQLIKLDEPLELKVQSLEELSNGLFINPTIGIYIIQDGRFELFNLQCETLTGYNDSELLGMERLELVIPEDREMVNKNALKILNGERNAPYEYRIQTKDGELKWILEILTQIKYRGKPAVLGNFTDITESKQAQKDLKYYSNIIDVNDASLKLYGTNHKADLIGKKSADIIAPEDREKALENLEKVLKKGSPEKHEYDLVVKDGSKIPVEINAAVMKGDNDKPVGFVGVVRDLSERRRMEEALKRAHHEVEQAIVNRTSELQRASKKLKSELAERKRTEAIIRESEEKYSTLVEKSNDGIIIIKDGKLEFVNSKFGELTGFSVNEVIGKSFIEFVSQDFRDLVLDNYRKRLTGKRVPERYEVELVSKKGRKIQVELNGALMEYEGGMADIAIIRDITERKKIEEALRESEERYRTISELTSDFIFKINIKPDGQIEMDSICTGFKWIDDYNFKNIKDPKIWCESVYSEDLKSFQKFIDTVIFKGKADELEFRAYTKENSIVWSHVVARPKLDPTTKRVITVVGAVKDFTERKLAEEKIKNLNEDLKRQTVQLEAVNHDLERFSYSISQGIRTTLKAIDGALQLLMKNDANKMDEQSKHLFNVIEYSANMLGHLVENLHTFAKMGGRELTNIEIDMEKLAKAVVKELKPTTARREVNFEVNSLPSVRGDPTMLRQVLFNLISNAIKFTKPNRSANIEIGGLVKKNENLYYIRDDGIGFDIRNADELYDVFKKLHSQEEFEGPGIGLTIVKRIIIRHGGRVWAEGEANKGATFYFAIPNKENAA